MMTKPGLARPVVIKMVRDIADDIIRSNMQTLGVSRRDFDALLAKARRTKKGGRRKKKGKRGDSCRTEAGSAGLPRTCRKA
jgi:hypothetical protein